LDTNGQTPKHNLLITISAQVMHAVVDVRLQALRWSIGLLWLR